MTVKNGYYKEKKPLKRIKEHCRSFTAFMFSNVGIIILVVFYTLGGAFMFREIEVSQSQNTMKHFGERNVKKIARRLWTETVINVLNEKDFKTKINTTLFDFQSTLYKSHLAGVGVNVTQQWSFSGAFLYSLTVITTIGEIIIYFMILYIIFNNDWISDSCGKKSVNSREIRILENRTQRKSSTH